MTPLWRRAFDAIERPVTEVSESWVQSESFMDLAAVMFRVQRRMLGEVHLATERWLQLWGWPSRADVVRLSNQVATLERQVREFRAEAEQRERPLLDGRQPKSRPRARQRSGRDGEPASRASNRRRS